MMEITTSVHKNFNGHRQFCDITEAPSSVLFSLHHTATSGDSWIMKWVILNLFLRLHHRRKKRKKNTAKDRRKTYFLEQCIHYSPIRKKKPLPSIYYIKNLMQGIDDNKP